VARAPPVPVRGEGAFAAACSGVRALVEAGVRAQVEVVLSAANTGECRDFIALGEALGASEVNFSAMTPHGRAVRRRTELLDHGSWTRTIAELRDASRTARVAVSPNCALLGDCCVNVEPHVTCDGWVTPCYLSTEKLFAVLDTPPEEMAPRLEASRGRYLDVCGREAWTKPGNGPPGRVRLPVVA
jgi:MoaA/NifB/PqqE/SkfB family radical SAM enzyme